MAAHEGGGAVDLLRHAVATVAYRGGKALRQAPSGFSAFREKLFQGPIADALTHIGQIAMLRRLAGAPVKGENSFRAEIAAGSVGPDPAPPCREFD